MNKKTKKIIISLTTILFFVGILIVLSFTVFSLKKVELNFKTSHSQISVTEEEIVDGGDFGYGQSVFFHNKKQYIEKIESIDPYIQVINIETVFPSTFVVHIAQRQEVYSIKIADKYFIVDQNLKILKIESDFVSSQSNSMLLEGIEILEKDYKVGDYIESNNYLDTYSAFFACNRTLAEQKSLIKSIQFEEEFDSIVNKTLINCNLYLFGGQTVSIKNCFYGFKYKANMFLSVYSQLYSLVGQKINASDENDPSVWTEELLGNCCIIVNNYYNYTEHSENECYFNVVPKQ